MKKRNIFMILVAMVVVALTMSVAATATTVCAEEDNGGGGMLPSAEISATPSEAPSALASIEPADGNEQKPADEGNRPFTEVANDFISNLLIFLSSAGVGLLVALTGIIKAFRTNKKLTILTTAYNQLSGENGELKKFIDGFQKVKKDFAEAIESLSAFKGEMVEKIGNVSSLDQNSLAAIRVEIGAIAETVAQIKKASGIAWKNAEGVLGIYSKGSDGRAASEIAAENVYLIEKIKELSGKKAEEIIAECKAKGQLE